MVNVHSGGVDGPSEYENWINEDSERVCVDAGQIHVQARRNATIDSSCNSVTKVVAATHPENTWKSCPLQKGPLLRGAHLLDCLTENKGTFSIGDFDLRQLV